MASPHTVVHLKSSPYLGISETWLYSYLIHMRRTCPIFLTHEIRNRDLYPLEHLYQLPDWRKQRPLWARIAARTIRQWRGIEGYLPCHLPYSRYIWKLRPQVKLLHAHYGRTGVFALPLRQLHRRPLITSFYGYDAYRLPQEEEWRQHYRQLFGACEQIVTATAAMKDAIVRLGCPEEKIAVIHVAVDLNEFSLQPVRKPEQHQNTVFLSVGNFVEKKGMAYTIQAFAQIHARYPATELRIIGDGPLRPELEQLVERLGVRAAVIFLGQHPNAVVKEQMKDCHIFVLASVVAADGDQEGTPRVLNEAAATGRPVIGTYHAGIPEGIQDGVSGFLVPERDVEALAAKMAWLVEHPESWEPMGRAGRRHVEQHYNAVTETAKLEDLYEEVIERHAGEQK